MKYVYSALAIMVLVVIIFAIGFGLGYKLAHSSQIAANDKALQAAQQHVQQVEKINNDLAATAGKLQAKIHDLTIANQHQPAKVRIVYVHLKPTAKNPSPAPTAVTSAVFVTIGAVSLFNQSFGVSQSSGSAGIDTSATSDLPSLITISDYERTTTGNAVACYQNQQTVILLWRYIHGLQAAGFVDRQ